VSEYLPTPIEQIGVQPPPKADPRLLWGFLAGTVLLVTGLLAVPLLIWVGSAVVIATGASLLGHHIYNQPEPVRPEAMFSTPGHWQGEEFIPDAAASAVPPESPAEQTMPIPVHRRWRRRVPLKSAVVEPGEVIQYKERIHVIGLLIDLFWVALYMEVALALLVARAHAWVFLLVQLLLVAAVEAVSKIVIHFKKKRDERKKSKQDENYQPKVIKLDFTDMRCIVWGVTTAALFAVAFLPKFAGAVLVGAFLVHMFRATRTYVLWYCTFYIVNETQYRLRYRPPWFLGREKQASLALAKIDTFEKERAWYERLFKLSSATVTVDTPATHDTWAHGVRHMRKITELQKLLKPRTQENPVVASNNRLAEALEANTAELQRQRQMGDAA